MAFVKKDLKPFARGDDWTLKFTITNSAGTPVNITGYTFWLTLKANADAADPGDAQVTATSGSPDAANGIVYVTVPKAQTNVLTPGTYNYDLQQKDTNNNVETLLIGKVKVAKDLTRTFAT